MPKFHHRVETPFSQSFRTQKIQGMFDIPPTEMLSKEWDVDLPIEDKEWEIGLIVGPSGAGKTTLAKRIFGDDKYHEGFTWGRTSIVDDFPEDCSVSEITSALSHVGFGSPPEWQKPYGVLSNGQKFRAEMARVILEAQDLLVVDEFTSVVDRQVAKAVSSAVQKYVRRTGKQFVAVSCHYDIIEWLQPDWVYYVDTNTFKYTRGSLRRPEIKIRLQRVHHTAWGLFKGHHYLSSDLNKSAHCYVGSIDEDPVVFIAALKFPHPHALDIWKAHRTVVLPDYQGLGIGNAVSKALAKYYYEMGYRFTSVTSHPGFTAARVKSPDWVMTRAPGQVPAAGKNSKVTGQSVGRMTAAFEYVGNAESKALHDLHNREIYRNHKASKAKRVRS